MKINMIYMSLGMHKENRRGGSQGPSCMYARGGEHSGAYRVQHGGWGGSRNW